MSDPRCFAFGALSCSIAPALSLFLVASVATVPAAWAQEPPVVLKTYAGMDFCGDFVDVSFMAGGTLSMARRSGGLDDFYDRQEEALTENGSAFNMTDGGKTRYLSGTLENGGRSAKISILDRDGQQEANCTEAFLELNELQPAEHYAALFTALAAAEPTLEEAQKVAKLLRQRPAPTFISDLERPAEIEKLKQAKKGFWQRFWAVEMKRLDAMPAGTADDVAALASRVNLATQDGMTDEDTTVKASVSRNDPTSDSGSFVYAATQLLADRQHAVGLAPKPLAFGGDRLKCLRPALAGHVGGIDGLEAVFGLPVEYWDTAAIESMKAETKACAPAVPDSRKSFLAAILTTFEVEQSEAKKRFDNRIWLEAERDRLLALPRNAASLKDSNGYQFNEEAARDRTIDDRAIARFFERSVAPIRIEAVAAATAEITTLLAAAQPGSAEETRAAAMCQDLSGIEPMSQVCRDLPLAYASRLVDARGAAMLDAIKSAAPGLARLRVSPNLRLPAVENTAFQSEFSAASFQADERLRAAAGPLIAEALPLAKSEITALFAQAQLGESEKAAKALCEGENLIPDLYETCQQAQADYLVRREVLICDAAIGRAKPTPENLAGRFGFKDRANAIKIVSGRDVICQVAKLGFRATFEDNSGFFSSGLRMKLDGDTQAGAADLPLGSMLPAGAGFQALFSAKKDATGPYWTFDTVADAQGNALPSMLMPVDAFGCLMSGVC
jgi:hypothetical protein